MKITVFLKSVLALCAALFFFACNSDFDPLLDEVIDVQVIETPEILDDETFVSLELATEVADAFFNEQTTVKSSGSWKTVAITHTLKEDGIPLMYVMNYTDGGFILE